MLHDPNLFNLRKATRVAIVMPGVFAIGFYGFDDLNVALFSAFAAFAALGLADFGGTHRRRFVAYGGLLVIGAGLVALGTVVSRSIALAAIVMLVVGFVIVFAGVLGGYWEAGTSAAVLAFVLAATIEAPNSQLGSRELGWLLGAGLAAVAAVVLWPGQERPTVRRAAAAVAGAVADLVDPQHAEADEQRDAARASLADKVAALHALTGLVFRPVGSARADREPLTLFVGDIDRIGRVAGGLESSQLDPPENRALFEAVAQTLRDTARQITAGTPALVDTTALEHARDTHRAALARAASVATASRDSSAVLDSFDRNFPVRRVSLLTVLSARQAEIARGVATEPRTSTPEVAERVVGAHLDFRSLRFRNALRAALGLALAVLLAKALDIEHGFWVVLGTLTVLRSNAIGTRRTAVQALLGTLLGFGLATALMLVIDRDTALLWAVFPIVALLAAYTPGALNFVLGQASFTVLVVDMFNLVIPEGWRTGLVRVQDIALGAAISVVVGLALWPRGAEGVVRTTFADLLEANRELLDAALDRVEARPNTVSASADDDGLGRAEAAVHAARDHALAALQGLASERGAPEAEDQPWASLFKLALAAERTAEGVNRDGTTETGEDQCPALRTAVVTDGRAIAAAVATTATLASKPREARNLPALDEAVDSAPPSADLAAAFAACVAAGEAPPVQLLWAHEWLRYLDQLLANAQPVSTPTVTTPEPSDAAGA